MIKTDILFVELRDRLLGRYIPKTSKIEVSLGQLMNQLKVYGDYQLLCANCNMEKELLRRGVKKGRGVTL